MCHGLLNVCRRQRAAEQRDGLAADVQRLTERLRYSAEDLEQAQAAQEVLLREKHKYQQNMDEAVAKVDLQLDTNK